MSHALDTNKDFWDIDTPVHITKLEVLKPRIKELGEPGGKQVAAGQLFTARAVMQTEMGGRVEVSVTGYLRANLDINNPREWLPTDCFAPRKHNSEIPPIRLLSYPKNLCTVSGALMRTLELSKLISAQLEQDNEWREHICSKVPAITAEQIRNELGLAEPEPEPEVHATSAEPEESPVRSEEQSEDVAASDDFNLDEDDLNEIAEDINDSDEKDDDLDLSFDDLGDDDTDQENDDLDAAGMVDNWEAEDQQLDEKLSNLDGDEAFSENASSTTPASTEPNKPSALLRALNVFKGREDTERPSEPANETADQSGNEGDIAPTQTTQEPETLQRDTHSAEQGQPEAETTSHAPASDTVVEQVEPTETPKMSDPKETEEPQKAVVREHHLHHEEGFDVAFFGIEHGESLLADKNAGEKGTLYTTRGGRVVLHIDEALVEDFAADAAAPLFDRMGYGREAKKLYKSANIECVRWLD